MWTGDKVISKVISRKSLEDINDVLKRPVVIWDNAHANDYDQKRVFLGPYSGRSPDIIQVSSLQLNKCSGGGIISLATSYRVCGVCSRIQIASTEQTSSP